MPKESFKWLQSLCMTVKEKTCFGDIVIIFLKLFLPDLFLTFWQLISAVYWHIDHLSFPFFSLTNSGSSIGNFRVFFRFWDLCMTISELFIQLYRGSNLWQYPQWWFSFFRNYDSQIHFWQFPINLSNLPTFFDFIRWIFRDPWTDFPWSDKD